MIADPGSEAAVALRPAGERSAPADVHVGRDGWLFWVGRSNVILPLYRRQPGAWWRLRHWRRLIDTRVARAEALGCRYLQVVVPDKLSVYDDRLSRPIVDARRSPARRLGAAVWGRHPGVWVDLLEPFRAARDRDLLYLRTDTHWTRSGYLLAYRLLCLALGTTPQPHVLEASFELVEGAFDIGHKFDPPLMEWSETFAFESRARRVEVNGLVTFREKRTNHMVGTSAGSRIVTRASGAGVDPRRIVLFGDSYSFHESGLRPMLAETCAELHALWSSPIDWAYVERVRPDVIVHEIAERFLFRLPVDDIDIDAFAAARLEEAVRAEAGLK